MANAWWMQTQGTTTRAIEAAERFAAKEAALDALIAAGPGGGTNYLHQAPPLLLDHDQIRLWPTTPIEGIPAQGSNKAILMPASIGYGHVAIVFNWVADYMTVDPSAFLSVASSDGITRQDYTSFDDLVQAGESVVWTPSYAVLAGSGFSPFSFTQANTPVMLSVTNGALGNFTGGDPLNTMQVTLLFYVLDLTTGLLVAA